MKRVVKDDSIARKYLFLSILLLVLLQFVMIGCSSTPTEPTPTQAELTPTSDLSIVWSDDFEDGEKKGWKDQLALEISFVSDGVLTTGPDSGCEISHESIVSRGTWSFDLFYPEEPDNIVPFYQFCLTCDQDLKFGFGINTRTEGSRNSSVAIVTLENGEIYVQDSVSLGRKLVGWMEPL